ncbi:hypothetical protein [Streptomyces lydicus]|uniref:hypothetical protein n=1 Tax=Streptomyces lydicus TaxID=47763 RepID=UPI002870877F|nr:hypothetical protein [Streptomyces lydicus]
MLEPMARCLARVRALLIPRASGRHRAVRPCAHLRPAPVRTVLVRPWSPPPLPGQVRRHRPAETRVDGDRSPLVRPYYAAYERRPQPAEVVW